MDVFSDLAKGDGGQRDDESGDSADTNGGLVTNKM